MADQSDKAVQPTFVCPVLWCKQMIIIEILARKQFIRAPPHAARRTMNTSAFRYPAVRPHFIGESRYGRLCLVA